MVASAVELETAIGNFIRDLERGLTIEAVILYGSYARGTAYELSDIDLAIISPDFDGMPVNRRQDMIARLEKTTDWRISPIGYPSSEYHKPRPNSFLAEIVRTGKVVYSNP
jgi:uncharacterized protein